MGDDLVKRLRPDPRYKTALEIALDDAQELIPALATLQILLGQGDYPTFADVVRGALRDMARAADRIKDMRSEMLELRADKEAAEAKLAKAAREIRWVISQESTPTAQVERLDRCLAEIGAD